MAGAPTEAEIQAQWRNAVNVLETIRNFADGTVVPAGGLLDVLEQSLEGTYTARNIPAASARVRSALSSIVNASTASALLDPILLEYGTLISQTPSTGYGGSYTGTPAILRALYENFASTTPTPKTVQTRAITFDTTQTAAAGNVGNGALTRLTEDAYGYPMEAVYVETKAFRCRADAQSGTKAGAELFEMLGEASSIDALLLGSTGSGTRRRATIVNKNAGSGNGGSDLTNGSFSTYDAAASPKFSGWTETAGGANIVQDTTNFYRSFPNATTDASLRINGGSGTVTLSQTLANMRISSLLRETPYFFRVMVNADIGSAVGGNIVIRFGATTKAIAVSDLDPGWNEITLDPGQGCWFRNFNEPNFDVQIEWATSTSGYLLVDDCIVAPWDLIDGTYWCLRQNDDVPVDWAYDDLLTFTDTGGAPGTGKIQYWLWLMGLGYLPSSGTPTFTDPT